MYLKRLEIFGFKTFAQRTIFEFPPGVTAIVGPNGSGKSNVADALRWVLGEQSFANLRARRSDELIFSGGRGRPPNGFAEVLLTIDNSDRLLDTPYDEVTIGRRAYRSGENEYTINRARVRLRDVLDLLAPLGSSYTLINQGLVDAALALHPEERRRLFEDAAEIGPYQARKQEAERRLRETEANLLRLNDLLSELEPQLRTLKRQARDAEAVGAVEAELRAHLQRFYHQQWLELNARLAHAEQAAQAAAQRLQAARAARDALLAELQAARDRLRDRRVEVEQQRYMLTELERQRESLARELAVAAERSAGFEQRRSELAQRRRDLDAQRASMQTRIAELEAQIRQAESELAQARERLAAADTRLRHAQRQRQEAETAARLRREELLRAQARLDTERARQDEIAGRLAAVQRELTTLADAQARARAQIAARGAALAEAQTALEAAEQALEAAEQRLEHQRSALERLRESRAMLDEQSVAARRRFSELQTRYETLQRMARSYDGTFAGVRAAMQWAERAGRAGFALVSSLLRVPAELEMAIEVALGARLQQIVVERWEDAEAAIAHLKRSNAGRATFLPLDSLRVGRSADAPRLDGIRGVAADLVEVDARYALVARYLLGRTLIAEDLPAARRALAQLEGGWTIVTLGGEQVAAGGALTGGAATRESGTLRRERELRELPAQVAAAQADVERLQRERERLTREIEQAQSAIRAAEQGLRDARSTRETRQRALEAQRREVHRAEDELVALHRRQAALTGEMATLEQRVQQVAAAIAAAATALREAEAAAQAAQTLLDEHLARFGEEEPELQAQRAEVVRRETALQAAQAELRAARDALGRVERARAHLEQQWTLQIEEEHALRVQIETGQGAQLQLDEQVALARSHQRAAEAELQQAEQAVEALAAREQSLTAELLALETTHAEAQIEVERRRGERDLLWERAAEDNIDPEQLTDEAAPLDGVDALPLAELPQRIEQLRARLRRMGPVNALAPAEYRAVQERYDFLTTQLADVRSAAQALREAIAQLDQVMQTRFTTTFTAVAREFSRTFTELFGGGSARLVLLEDRDATASQGVEIVVQPPGKRQLNLQLLSGGERALTAVALLFAILRVNPSPFCMLDEVDAALDEANVVRFREALLELAQRTQFILITHNRGTVEAANTLYGITMGDDSASRVVSLRLEEIDADGTLTLASVPAGDRSA
ncbi:chromosome segregation protein SMC [Kallotenue papyrolyticum]|uniref:chromosome segregation protein SMC n=1 Tax=Kallotenue papyrolyticum TaxID=1325125 RepID=UPI00046F7B49|nr:chromosome segregation protein SMC [Kallotenue papyrolyticum]